MSTTLDTCMQTVPAVRALLIRHQELSAEFDGLKERSLDTTAMHLAETMLRLSRQFIDSVVTNLGHIPAAIDLLADLLGADRVEWISDMTGDAKAFAYCRDMTEEQVTEAELAEVIELLPLAEQLTARAEQLVGDVRGHSTRPA